MILLGIPCPSAVGPSCPVAKSSLESCGFPFFPGNTQVCVGCDTEAFAALFCHRGLCCIEQRLLAGKALEHTPSQPGWTQGWARGASGISLCLFPSLSLSLFAGVSEDLINAGTLAQVPFSRL